MGRPIVIGLGELLWDMLPEGKKAGGAPINFVYHASRLGAEGYAVTAVGKDESGDEIIAELEANDIRYMAERVDYPTGTVNVVLNNGIPQYDIVQDVAWDHIPLTARSLETARKADAVCFGSLARRSPESRETIRTIVKAVPEKSYRCFDINLRQHYYSKEIIEQSLEMSNVFKINDEELTVLKGLYGLTGSDGEICRRFIDKYSLKYLILTAGADFSTVYTADAVSNIVTPEVKVADTVGAGDAFLGAFIAALLDGKPMEEAHKAAVTRAALVCTRKGAWCI